MDTAQKDVLFARHLLLIWSGQRYRGYMGTEGRVVFLKGILVLLCGGVGMDRVRDAPHLLCRGLIVCLLLHPHSQVTQGWMGVFSGDRIVQKFVVIFIFVWS